MMSEIKITGMEVVRMKRVKKLADKKSEMMYKAHVSRCLRY
jgi:hypothetical protein